MMYMLCILLVHTYLFEVCVCVAQLVCTTLESISLIFMYVCGTQIGSASACLSPFTTSPIALQGVAHRSAVPRVVFRGSHLHEHTLKASPGRLQTRSLARVSTVVFFSSRSHNA